MRQLQSKRLMAAINVYGNIQIPAPKGLVHVPGRVHRLCDALGIPYAKAVVGFKNSRRYRYKPQMDGVVIDERHNSRLSEALSKRIVVSAEVRERRRQEAADKRAAALYAAADEIGAKSGGTLVRAYMRGRIDRDLARLLAFKAHYRHEHTDYEALFEVYRDCCIDRDDLRRTCREQACDSAVPTNWQQYLETYHFEGDIAEAMARILKDPRRCHPTWFYEGIIALERLIEAGEKIDLWALSYPKIRGAIARWRAERDYD